MKIETKFTKMFGIEKPIIQGGMQHIGVPAFASLFSNAGGMGTINITCYKSPEEFADAVAEMNELTDKPWIVNISLAPDLTKGDEIFKYIDVCARGKVAAIEFAAASPEMFMPACKEAGIKIIHKSPNAHVAKRMVWRTARAWLRHWPWAPAAWWWAPVLSPPPSAPSPTTTRNGSWTTPSGTLC